MLLRMRRNHKQLTSRARNVPVTRLRWREQSSCSRQLNLLPKTCLVFAGLQPLGPNRTTLEIIIPSQSGLTPEKWKETATLCPLDWPSNYSLLRLWHTNGSLHQTEARLRNQLSHSHMFAEWTVHLHRFAERVLFQQPAVYVAGHASQTNLRERNFPDRKVRRRVPPTDLDEHQRAIRALLQRATDQQRVNPVSFGLTNEWNDTITSDKKHYLEHFTRGMT